jgi:hypothetical protein
VNFQDNEDEEFNDKDEKEEDLSRDEDNKDEINPN